MRANAVERDAVTPFVGRSRVEMGQRAAEDVAAELQRKLGAQERVRMIFAAAPSQQEMLSALVSMPRIDWGRVTAFHMDEYLGLELGAPQRFGVWLRRAIFDRVPFGAVHLIEPGNDADASAREYA